MSDATDSNEDTTTELPDLAAAPAPDTEDDGPAGDDVAVPAATPAHRHRPGPVAVASFSPVQSWLIVSGVLLGSLGLFGMGVQAVRHDGHGMRGGDARPMMPGGGGPGMGRSPDGGWGGGR